MSPLEINGNSDINESRREQKLLVHHEDDSANIQDFTEEDPEGFQNRLDVTKETKHAINLAI